MKRRVLLTVGNGLMGDDGAAVWLAHLVKEAPLEGWEVIEGGSAPENVLHRVRELTPQRVLVVDSAEMGLPAGGGAPHPSRPSGRPLPILDAHPAAELPA